MTKSFYSRMGRNTWDFDWESVVERGSIPLDSTKKITSPLCWNAGDFVSNLFNGVDRLRHGISNMIRTTRGQPALVEEKEYLQTILNSPLRRDGLNSQETEMF